MKQRVCRWKVLVSTLVRFADHSEREVMTMLTIDPPVARAVGVIGWDRIKKMELKDLPDLKAEFFELLEAV